MPLVLATCTLNAPGLKPVDHPICSLCWEIGLNPLHSQHVQVPYKGLSLREPSWGCQH